MKKPRMYAIIVVDEGFGDHQLSDAKSLLDNSTIKLPTGCIVQGAKELKEKSKLLRDRTYHGWILVESGGEGFKDYIYIEYDDGTPERYRRLLGRAESGCAVAVEWWDKKVGKPVKLQPMLKGSYRVYTE